jgi:hypothetical protein
MLRKARAPTLVSRHSFERPTQSHSLVFARVRSQNRFLLIGLDTLERLV